MYLHILASGLRRVSATPTAIHHQCSSVETSGGAAGLGLPNISSEAHKRYSNSTDWQVPEGALILYQCIWHSAEDRHRGPSFKKKKKKTFQIQLTSFKHRHSMQKNKAGIGGDFFGPMLTNPSGPADNIGNGNGLRFSAQLSSTAPTAPNATAHESQAGHRGTGPQAFDFQRILIRGQSIHSIHTCIAIMAHQWPRCACRRH